MPLAGDSVRRFRFECDSSRIAADGAFISAVRELGSSFSASNRLGLISGEDLFPVCDSLLDVARNNFAHYIVLRVRHNEECRQLERFH
jgi:hypothetical protein